MSRLESGLRQTPRREEMERPPAMPKGEERAHQIVGDETRKGFEETRRTGEARARQMGRGRDARMGEVLRALSPEEGETEEEQRKRIREIFRGDLEKLKKQGEETDKKAEEERRQQGQKIPTPSKPEQPAATPKPADTPKSAAAAMPVDAATKVKVRGEKWWGSEMWQNLIETFWTRKVAEEQTEMAGLGHEWEFMKWLREPGQEQAKMILEAFMAGDIQTAASEARDYAQKMREKNPEQLNTLILYLNQDPRTYGTIIRALEQSE